MPDTSSARRATTSVSEPGLVHALTPLLREWLPRQRWFAGKGKRITGFALVSATELRPAESRPGTPGLLHLLLDVHQAGTRPDCYQLLLGTRPLLPASLAPAMIGRVTGGPLDGLTVYEALHDPRLAGVLLERLRAPGRSGTLRFTTESHASIQAGLTPRLSTAEQSNTSVVYGDTYILKLFRRVAPGANPDLELSLALARAGSRRVAEPVAWFESIGTHEETATLGVLQRFLPDSADAWAVALDAVRTGSDFTADSYALGRATAEVHTALAGAMPTTVLRHHQIEQLAVGMAERLDIAAAAVPALAPYRTRLRVAFHSLAEMGAAGRTVTAQRVHGDLHLGQALRTPSHGWMLIDFEGEPARPLAERRRPQSPVQDVAGMLRSFDYAARHRDPSDSSKSRWADANRSAFCDGYAKASAADPRKESVLIRAYETDKAVYEVLYEARHRPDWLPIPMSAIERLASGGAGGPAAP